MGISLIYELYSERLKVCLSYNWTMNRRLVMLGAVIGMIAGGFLPSLWGDYNTFGIGSIISSTVGGFLGIWLGVWLSKRLS